MTTKEVKHILGNGTEIPYTRLYADAGKVLTSGEETYSCVDVVPGTESEWMEIDDPDPVPEEPTAEEVLSILLGGETSNNE